MLHEFLPGITFSREILSLGSSKTRRSLPGPASWILFLPWAIPPRLFLQSSLSDRSFQQSLVLPLTVAPSEFTTYIIRVRKRPSYDSATNKKPFAARWSRSTSVLEPSSKSCHVSGEERRPFSTLIVSIDRSSTTDVVLTTFRPINAIRRPALPYTFQLSSPAVQFSWYSSSSLDTLSTRGSNAAHHDIILRGRHAVGYSVASVILTVNSLRDIKRKI